MSDTEVTFRTASLVRRLLQELLHTPLAPICMVITPKCRHPPVLHSSTTTMKTIRSSAKLRFSLTQAMSSMMALGLSLEEVVTMVTINPAQMLGFADRIGALKVGYEADVSVLSDDRGRFTLRDNERTEVVADRLLRPVFCFRGGKRFNAEFANSSAGGRGIGRW